MFITKMFQSFKWNKEARWLYAELIKLYILFQATSQLLKEPFYIKEPFYVKEPFVH